MDIVFNYDECLKKLQASPFRSKFHLKAKDIAYVKEKGVDKIKSHAYDLSLIHI